MAGRYIPKGTVLGLGGAWGYAVRDLTSPVRAAEAAALPDHGLHNDPTVLELRIHGVSGSTGAVMLEHPNTLQVAGDTRTMFLRRWTPAGAGGVGIPWPAEAYSWGGLTESALASACWLLLTPFMLFNVASFAIPPMCRADLDAKVRESASGRRPGECADRIPRDRWHAVCQAVLRLLAVTGTVQFVLASATVLVDILALQAPLLRLPGWFGWFPRQSTHARVLLMTVVLLVLLAVLWVISVRTAHRYERLVSDRRGGADHQWPLTQPLFWNGQELVRRQRSLHLTVALGVTALVLTRPGPDMDALRWATAVVAGVALAAAAVMLCSKPADRHTVSFDRSLRGRTTSATRVCRLIFALGGLALVLGLCTTDWPVLVPPAPPAPPVPVVLGGLPGIVLAATALQLLLLGILGVLVFIVWRRSGLPERKISVTGPERCQERPYARGQLASVVAGLAVTMGATLSAVVVLFVTRLVGTPIPDGDPVRTASHPLYVPWPYFADALAPWGMLAGVLIAGVVLAVTFHRNRVSFEAHRAGNPSPVARFYRPAVDADPRHHGGDPHRNNRRRVARAWATGLLADQAGLIGTLVTVGGLVALVAGFGYHLGGDHWFSTSHLPWLVGIESWGGMLLAAGMVWALRRDVSSVDSRKTIGALWDVGTFWPRAVHPLAPPCYAERAVPELVDRIRILTGTVADDVRDPAWCQILDHRHNGDSLHPGLTAAAVESLLLTGYSQGAVIAPAVIAQLPPATLPKVSLLTLASPARRLYGRAFPAYFGPDQLAHLRDLLTDTAADGLDRNGGPRPPVRWKNLVRRTDYIGSWVMEPLEAQGIPDPSRVSDAVDQPCWDPVTIAYDLDQAPPPIHYHSGFWADIRVTQLGAVLLRRTPDSCPQLPPGIQTKSSGSQCDPELSQVVRHQGLEPRTR